MNSLKKSYTFEEIKQKLVNYCVYQDRCHSEVEIKMKEFLLIQEAKDDIFLYLIKENYLNEERFVRSYIRGKFYIKNWGKNKIRSHLIQKKISDKLIIRCFDEIFDEDYKAVALKIFENYYSKLTNLKVYQKKSKTIGYLINKGYEYEIIQKILENVENIK